MKNLFGVNITVNEENTYQDGEIFVTKRITPELEADIDKAGEENINLSKDATIPIWLTIVKYIFILGAVSFTFGIFQGNFSEGYKNVPWAYWITPFLWIFSIAIIGYEFSKSKKLYNSEEFAEHVEKVNKLTAEAGNYLDIPEEALETDVLMFRYVKKNDEIKLKKFPMFSHINFSFETYVQNDNLCLSNYRYVMEIPLQSIKSIHMEKKKASFPNWNKEFLFNSKEYKKFKIVCNNQGTYFAHYYSVQIQDIKGDFEFYVPNYDIENICRLTGLKTED